MSKYAEDQTIIDMVIALERGELVDFDIPAFIRKIINTYKANVAMQPVSVTPEEVELKRLRLENQAFRDIIKNS